MTHDVVIVGAGFSGIGMAIRLREMGIDDFVVLDRGHDLGGTWRDNSYPGAACDVPSNLYSYSFALNPEWSRSFPSQSEIWDYMRRCVDHFDVGRHLRFDRLVDEARWDETTQRWTVRAAGEEYEAPCLVWATGSLSEPTVPEFPGLNEFRGKVFHSARWEHGFDLTGKRVCVVGTGASAIQSSRWSSTSTCTSARRHGSFLEVIARSRGSARLSTGVHRPRSGCPVCAPTCCSNSSSPSSSGRASARRE